MAERLFLREASLTVGPAAGGEGREWTGLRLQFTVEKTSKSSTNKGKVSIFNLAPESRTFLESDDLVAIIKAGYRDFSEVLFIGDIPKNGVTTKRQGPDIVTTIECGDGEKALNQANLNQSWTGGVTNLQIFQAAALALGTDISIGVQKSFKKEIFGNGFAFSGMVKDLLDQLVEKQGLEWSIQNGTLQVLSKDDETGEEAVLLSPTTGLIDVPSKTEKGVNAISLLNPKIIPGRRIVIQSKQFLGALASLGGSVGDVGSGQGTFRIDKVTHVGDSDEGDWKSTVEGTTIGGGV